MEESKGETQGGGESQPPVSNLTMMDVLELPDAEREIVQFLLREGETEVSALLAQSGQEATGLHSILEKLAEKGFLGKGDREGAETWRALLAQKRGRQTSRNLWAALDDL